MSEGKSKLSYSEKLNIPTVTVGTAKRLLKNEIINTLNLLESEDPKIKRKVNKQTFRLIGPAGIGKTQIQKQICDELLEETGKEFELIVIKAPVLNRDDFLIPFPILGESGDYKKFEMLYSDFVPSEDRKYGLFVIDELSRGDHNLQQLMWQVEEENMLHLRDLPEGWFVVCLDNPDEAEYSTDMIEDAAGLRRKSQICVENSSKEFIEYASSAYFYPAVISYFRSHPDRIYDFRSQSNKMVYTNPASIEKFSNHCWKYDPEGWGQGILDNFSMLEIIAESLFNRNGGEQIMDFLKDASKTIKPEDILNNLHEEEIKNKIDEMIKNRDPKLSDLMTMFVQYLVGEKFNLTKQQKENIVTWLTTIPVDTAAIFVTEIDSLERNSEEFRYHTKLHMELDSKFPPYHTDFYEKMINTSQSTSDEKQE